jgi:hypothetical protein
VVIQLLVVPRSGLLKEGSYEANTRCLRSCDSLGLQ